MTTAQFFLTLAAIFLSPRLSYRTGDTLARVTAIVGVLMAIWEILK